MVRREGQLSRNGSEQVSVWEPDDKCSTDSSSPVTTEMEARERKHVLNVAGKTFAWKITRHKRNCLAPLLGDGDGILK